MDRRIVSTLFIIGIIWAVIAVLNLLPKPEPDIQPAIHVDPNVTLTFETPRVGTKPR
jgi:hypothetical protein